MNDLANIALTDLVEEIRRRSHTSLVAVVLKEEFSTSREADVRVFSHADPKHEIRMLGLADLAHDDARTEVRNSIMGPRERDA